MWRMSRWTGLKKGKKNFRETSQSYYLSTVVYLSRRDSPAQEGGVPNQNSVCAANARVLPMGAVAWSAWSLWFARFLRCLVPTSQPGALEFEVVAVRHQLTVLRRRLPGRPRLRLPDRVLWVWLYRLWPGCLRTMLLVKPATMVQWHCQGFRLYWRWRAQSRRPGQPRLHREVRQLIRQMSTAVQPTRCGVRPGSFCPARPILGPIFCA